MHVVGETIVVDDAPVFELVGHDYFEVTSYQQLSSVYRLSFPHIASTFCLYDVLWCLQPYLAIDAPAFGFLSDAVGFAFRALRVVAQRRDCISQESCSFAPRMGDERLFL